MAGIIAVDTIQNGSGASVPTTTVINGSAKAWVCYNGTAGTIRASYNVGSVTKNTTGDYTINFTNALADGNYALAGFNKDDTGYASRIKGGTTPSSTAFNIQTLTPGGSVSDSSYVNVSVFR